MRSIGPAFYAACNADPLKLREKVNPSSFDEAITSVDKLSEWARAGRTINCIEQIQRFLRKNSL
jgi:hypothetical protein